MGMPFCVRKTDLLQPIKQKDPSGGQAAVWKGGEDACACA